jgi:hypothetical protein
MQIFGAFVPLLPLAMLPLTILIFIWPCSLSTAVSRGGSRTSLIAGNFFWAGGFVAVSFFGGVFRARTRLPAGALATSAGDPTT